MSDESRKNCRREWDREHMATLSTRVPVDIASMFRNIAQTRGRTTYDLLRDYVLDYIVTDGHPEYIRRPQTPRR